VEDLDTTGVRALQMGAPDGGKIKVRKVRNAFVLFCSEQRHKPWTVGMAMPDQKRRCGEMWRAMSYAHKFPYQQQYEKDRAELKEMTRALKKEGLLLVVKKPATPLVPTVIGTAETLREDKLQNFLPYRKRGNTPGGPLRSPNPADGAGGDAEDLAPLLSPQAGAAAAKRGRSAKKPRGATPKKRAAAPVYAPAPIIAAAPIRQFDPRLEAEVLKRMSDKVRKIAGPDGVLPKMSQDAWTKMVKESMQQIKIQAPHTTVGDYEDEADLAAIDSGAEEEA
jgi:hypothetical protein